MLFWHVREGHYDNVKLDNLSYVGVGRWEGDLWARKATGVAGLYIDDHADDRQMEALSACACHGMSHAGKGQFTPDYDDNDGSANTTGNGAACSRSSAEHKQEQLCFAAISR